MAIESQIARMKAVLQREIAPDTATSSEQTEWVLAALAFDLPAYVDPDYAADLVSISFRTQDENLFRAIDDGVTFHATDDYLYLDGVGGPASCETKPIDLTNLVGGKDKRVALVHLSRDADFSGGILNYDLSPNANPNVEAAGFWLNADRNVTLNWDTDIYLDQYPTDGLVLKLTATGIMKVFSVQMRVLLFGSDQHLSRDVEAAGRFAAVYHFNRKLNKAGKMGTSEEYQRFLRKRINELSMKAAGFLTADRERSSRSSVKRLPGAPMYGNAYWERIKTQQGW